MERLTPKLIAYRLHDFGMAMADVEDAEAAETIDICATANVAIGVRPGIGPLDDRFRTRDVGRLAVFEKSGVDVLAERVDGFARDPRRVRGRDLRLADQLESALGVLINVACPINGNFLLLQLHRAWRCECAQCYKAFSPPRFLYDASSAVTSCSRWHRNGSTTLRRWDEQSILPALLRKRT